MKDIPEIVKELKEAEKIGLFQGKILSIFKEDEKQFDSQDEDHDSSVGFFEEDIETSKVVNNNVIEDKEKRLLKKSNEYYKTIFKVSPEAIVVINKKGVILDANERVYDWLGYNPEKIKGKNILHLPFLPKESISIIKKKFIQRMLGKKISPYEVDFIKKNGEKIVGRIHGAPIRENNKIIGDLVMISDVTEQKAAEWKLKNSENKFRSIFENSAIAITFTNENERIISWNKYAEKLLGRTDLIMKPVSSIYPPEEWQKIRSQNIRQKGMQHHLETQVYGKNNELIDVDISLSVLKDQKGKITGSIGVIKDISERKRAEQKVSESENKYFDLFENANDLIQAVKPDGTFLYVNRAWKKTLNYNDDEIQNLSVFDIIHPDSKEHCIEIFKRIMSGENIEKVETAFISKYGKVIDVEGSINCRFKDGKCHSARGIFRNVTEHKKFEEQLKSKINELERYKKITVDRELKMIELKKQIEELEGKVN